MAKNRCIICKRICEIFRGRKTLNTVQWRACHVNMPALRLQSKQFHQLYFCIFRPGTQQDKKARFVDKKAEFVFPSCFDFNCLQSIASNQFTWIAWIGSVVGFLVIRSEPPGEMVLNIRIILILNWRFPMKGAFIAFWIVFRFPDWLLSFAASALP